MKHLLLSTWLRAAVLLAALGYLPHQLAAQEDEPIIAFKSVAKSTANGDAVTIFLGSFQPGTDYIDMDCGSGTEEHEISQATINTTTGEWEGGTSITCTLSEDGWVKIYGDAANLAVINFSGCYISELQMADLPNLYYLNLEHNLLEGLDLSGKFGALAYLTLADNPFGKSPLKIGDNKPALQLLDISQAGRLDDAFSLADYPALVSFDAYACKTLKQVDLSNCPNLQRLSLDGTGISSIDVSQTPNLTILNISDTFVDQVDLSGLNWLQQFYADRQGTQTKLTQLDLTANKNLVYLFAAGNNFTEIDLSANTYLQQLYLADNRLEHIDLSNNTNLTNVILRGNCLDFATLPQPGNWNQYDYYQRNMPVQRTVKVGETLDFSARVLREGTVTTCGVYTVSEDIAGSYTALPADYYTYADGKVTFLKAPTDSVYVAFANDMFPDLQLDYMPLRTEKFKVKTADEYGQKDLALTVHSLLASSAGVRLTMRVGMAGATPETPKQLTVRDADGNEATFDITSQSLPETCNVDFSSRLSIASIYVPQDEMLTALAIEDQTLTGIDLSQARTLQQLQLSDTELYSIDLGYNRNLKQLKLNGNHFFALNIRGVNDAYQKTLLTDIDLSDNELREVTLNDMGTIHNLNLSDNQLTELSLKDADNMRSLDLSGNQLTTVNLSYCTLMTDCDLSNNLITEIAMPAEHALRAFHCENNSLNFSTLPQLTDVADFTFAPQNKVAIVGKAPSIDLQAHNINGQTVYVWKKTDGTPLAEGTDYLLTDGMTRFLQPAIGSMVYCEMSNPLYEGLTLVTTETEAADMPQHKLATFTTLADGNATMVLRAHEPITLCIDWKGGGHSVESYTVDDNLVTTPIVTHAGAECAIYSYSADCPLYVLNISNTPLADVDLTNLTNLVLVNLENAQLDRIKLPDTNTLTEIKLDKNRFSELDLSRYAEQLHLLSLNNNLFTSFDAAGMHGLFSLSMGGNQLQRITLDNREMWNLDLSGNALTEIDLSKVPQLNQLFLTNNQLHEIDLSAQADLHALHIDYNRFSFSTLPLPSSQYGSYQYGNQAELEVEADANGVVDLSSEAMVGSNATTFRWFVDYPWYDENTGELTGEELYIDEEYTVENGVTQFLSPIENVVCALLNDQFPNLTLYTKPMDVTTAAAIHHAVSADKSVQVAVNGRTLRIAADGNEAVKVYTTDGRLAAQTQTAQGTASLTLSQPGVYLVECNGRVVRVALH